MDTLAISFGTLHRLYRGEPKLNFDIVRAVKARPPVKLLMHGASGDLEQLAPIATKFCEMMIVDDKQRKAIVNDVMACIDLYGSDPVQKDIERFLSRWGVVMGLLGTAENPASTNE